MSLVVGNDLFQEEEAEGDNGVFSHRVLDAVDTKMFFCFVLFLFFLSVPGDTFCNTFVDLLDFSDVARKQEADFVISIRTTFTMRAQKIGVHRSAE